MKAKFIDGPLEGEFMEIPVVQPILSAVHWGKAPKRLRDLEYFFIGVEYETGTLLYRLFPSSVPDLNSWKLTDKDKYWLYQCHISSE